MPRICFAALALVGLVSSAAVAVQPASMPVADWSHLTVVTVAGETYPDVAVAWVGRGEAVLLTRTDGATLILQLEQIRDIMDAEGQPRRDDLVALRNEPDQQNAPTQKTMGDFVDIVTAPVTLAEATDLRTWLFNWAFGAGPGQVSTLGGEFPSAGSETILSNTIRRRIFRHQFLSLTSLSMHLADQVVPDWYTSGTRLVEWQESQLFLSYGHYYRPHNWYWEMGLGVLQRTFKSQGSSGENTYLKGAVRLQFGRQFELSRHFAIDVALFAALKPGFEDTGGGSAADLGLRGELVVW